MAILGGKIVTIVVNEIVLALPQFTTILELAVSGQQKTAIREDSGVHASLVLIAGARNHRYLHLDFTTL